MVLYFSLSFLLLLKFNCLFLFLFSFSFNYISFLVMAVYTWGRGDQGQLGHGTRREHRKPTIVEALLKVSFSLFFPSFFFFSFDFSNRQM